MKMLANRASAGSGEKYTQLSHSIGIGNRLTSSVSDTAVTTNLNGKGRSDKDNTTKKHRGQISNNCRPSKSSASSSLIRTRLRDGSRPRIQRIAGITDTALGAKQARDQLVELEKEVTLVQEKALSRQDSLQSRFENIEKDLQGLIAQKQMEQNIWLLSLAEIDEKGNQAQSKLQGAMEEIELLRNENSKIRNELARLQSEYNCTKDMEKSLQKQIVKLGRKLDDSRKEARTLKLLLRAEHSNEPKQNQVKNPRLKSAEVPLKVDPNQLSTLHQFEAIIEKVQDLMKRQSTTKDPNLRTQTITISSPPASQTVVTTFLPPSKNNKAKARAVLSPQCWSATRACPSYDETGETLIRELFFRF